MKLTRCLTATVLGLTTLLPAQQLTYGPQPAERDWTAAGNAWWAHIQYLADDKLKGRQPGTPGFDAAVAYVEGQFKAIGLKPAGTQGYRQPVPMHSIALDATKSSFALVQGGTGTPLAVGKDVMLNAHVTGKGEVSAPLVFIGYGLVLPSKRMNALTGVDVKGKVVVYVNNAPENVLGPVRAYSQVAKRRWIALAKAGAVGSISLTMPRAAGGRGGAAAAPAPGASTLDAPATTDAAAAPAARQRPVGGGNAAPAARATTILADVESLPGMRLNAAMPIEASDKLLVGSGHTAAELLALSKAGKPIPSFALTTSVKAETGVIETRTLTAPNVVGLLPGSDPKLSKEYIVISAHLDHLGEGRAVNGDTIYNGAMDNASGVASVIETAKLLAAGPKLKRSVIFIALEGEEMGELGSEYFANKPTVPKAQIVADLNMDMYLPLFPLHYLEIQGLGESTLGNDMRAICQLNDVEPQFDKQPAENRFIRSDQVNFVDQGIPALAFKFGWVPDSPEMKTFNEWVAVRYHKPSDDLDQPVDKVGAAQFDNMLAQLAARVADAPTRPSWYPESSFASVGK